MQIISSNFVLLSLWCDNLSMQNEPRCFILDNINRVLLYYRIKDADLSQTRVWPIQYYLILFDREGFQIWKYCLKFHVWDAISKDIEMFQTSYLSHILKMQCLWIAWFDLQSIQTLCKFPQLAEKLLIQLAKIQT